MRRIALLVSALTLVLFVTGCGDTPDDAGNAPGDSSQVELVFEGGSAPPTERIQLEVGETLEVVVTSDEAGELHVHSDPEQTLPYDEGTTTLELTIDQPGVVEVERHDPEALVLQLEVR